MATMIDSVMLYGITCILKYPTKQQENWLQRWLTKEFAFAEGVSIDVFETYVDVGMWANGRYCNRMFSIPHNKEYKEARVILKDDIMSYLVKGVLRRDF